jgi:hypothetical protein
MSEVDDILQERAERERAEREAREARAELRRREEAELSETERLRKENEENRAKVEVATAKARGANLLTALADKGLVGAKAKAAARLLDGVEYDDDGEPLNLDAAIETARAAYGEEVFTTAPSRPSGLTTAEQEAAKRAGMSPQQYEAMKGVRTFEDWQAAQRRLAEAAQ